MLDRRIDHIDKDAVMRMSRTDLYDLFTLLYHDNTRLQGLLQEKEDLIASLLEYKKLANAEKYEPASERMESLFPELETTIAYRDKPREAEADVPGKKERRPKRPVLRLPKDAKVVEVRHYGADVPRKKTVGGIEYERIEDKVVIKAGYVPSSRYVEVHKYAQYRAVSAVGEGERERIADGMEEAGLEGVSAAPSLLAKFAVSKFDDHLPFYRQEEILAREGFPVSRQQMCRWLQACYDRLTGFDLFFGRQVFRMNLVQQDETPCEVLSIRSPSGKISGSSYVVIRVGSTFDREKLKWRRIVQMSYSDGRAREKLFDGFGQSGYHGPLMTDGLKGYFDGGFFAQDRHASCWVHAVRRLKKYARHNPKDPDVFEILTLYGQLNTIEKECRRLLESGAIGADEFLRKRKEWSVEVIDGIFKIVDKFVDYRIKDSLAEAVGYLRDHRDHLYVYLDHLECTPDNNECERRAKAFAVGRKNWLFNVTVDGIDASCFYYSLVETAKACGLNPQDYLEYVFTRLPYADEKDYGNYLPWNIDDEDFRKVVGRKREAKADPSRTEDYVLSGFRH